ncbi:hypothetical protein I302_102453 [Kwoniella bestiolae CBS 10118]|uniref:Uncharacterized protein n=1 Tax=Kwoniella bestiolae CBS 10118 TaxID=1296100 RepID=A0A1B9GF20_9TREE|nr:hypothetical protein I302_01143 [Kwoniella bestiolae CBS 10118]OCF29634.1 hypothetical protein I302_01143 [Kwoniella bestiolae CBS 10118]
MGSSHSTPRHYYNGPLFGGHYPGDFSIRHNIPNTNKPLPAPPKESRSVRFSNYPPAWVFYKNRPADENLANTRYCSPPSTRSNNTPPPAYGTWEEGPLTVRNQ